MELFSLVNVSISSGSLKELILPSEPCTSLFDLTGRNLSLAFLRKAFVFDGESARELRRRSGGLRLCCGDATEISSADEVMASKIASIFDVSSTSISSETSSEFETIEGE